MYLHLTLSVLISLQLTTRAKAADAGIQKRFSDLEPMVQTFSVTV